MVDLVPVPLPPVVVATKPLASDSIGGALAAADGRDLVSFVCTDTAPVNLVSPGVGSPAPKVLMNIPPQVNPELVLGLPVNGMRPSLLVHPAGTLQLCEVHGVSSEAARGGVDVHPRSVAPIPTPASPGRSTADRLLLHRLNSLALTWFPLLGIAAGIPLHPADSRLTLCSWVALVTSNPAETLGSLGSRRAAGTCETWRPLWPWGGDTPGTPVALRSILSLGSIVTRVASRAPETWRPGGSLPSSATHGPFKTWNTPATLPSSVSSGSLGSTTSLIANTSGPAHQPLPALRTGGSLTSRGACCSTETPGTKPAWLSRNNLHAGLDRLTECLHE
mmetsp:Transcript_20924/g.32799  ORF Transcript_20924/g.32799 Transcript_20924/m.32799 type:complete len:334 (-) Transcript_20924:303-1304(-)